MKRMGIFLLALVFALGFAAAVYAQNGGSEPEAGKICKPGSVPILSGTQTQLFETEDPTSHFDAQCTCNQVAESYHQYSCYAVPSSQSTRNVPKLWYCLCKEKK
ncbi:MAG: hypothetical protein M0Z75_09200 [Nitrospiraceae bacterium]|nr:hypothetical protein [Nitrospiraceae bacterium]